MGGLLMELTGVFEGQQLEDETLMLGSQLDRTGRDLGWRLAHPRRHGDVGVVVGSVV